MSNPFNLVAIDSIVDKFLVDNAVGIATMNRLYFSESGDLANRALSEELKDELRTGCVTFFNKEDADPEELSPYLFYIANAFCKKKSSSVNSTKKKTEYVCPGCLFLGKHTLVPLSNNLFRCDECEASLKSSQDPKMVSFFRHFFRHNKSGYHCQDCDRFIPHPIDNSPTLSCPYLDCSFVGVWSSLKRMHHPSSQSRIETLSTDDAFTSKTYLVDDQPIADIKLEQQETLLSQIKMLRDIIDSQKNNVPYSSAEATAKHKYLCYEAFDSCLKSSPTEMVNYLLNGSRSGGFQSKVFQEYIRLLEGSLPYSFKKNNKQYVVESLLDPNINLFSGISEFDSIVSHKLDIKNETKEFYIGGRKGAISQPFYIGKLLSVIDKNSKKSLMENVKEYTFSKIKMQNISPGTEVIVTHLRVPPHYQMGGMVYVNRIRKKIIERAQFLMSKENKE